MLVALAAASAVASTYASYKKGQAEREAAKNQQALRILEAKEMERRNAYNLDLLRSKINDANQETLAKMGVSTTGGAGGETSSMVKDTLLSNMTKELERAKIEAEFDTNLRYREADAAGSQAAAINRMTPLQTTASILGGATNVYDIYKRG